MVTEPESEAAGVGADEKLIVGDFNNVRIFLSQRPVNQTPSWTDTKLCGVLKLIQVSNVGVPMVVLRLIGCDLVGNERGLIMQYELPLNFYYKPDLSPTFMALKVIKG